jgi:hypothetical protein
MSWDALKIGLPQVVITGNQLEVIEASEQQYVDYRRDGDMGVEVMQLF